MPTPIVVLAGKAGSGKDTVAGFMAKDHGAVAIAQADPLKRFAKTAFGFTDEQLWGPSDRRNAVDTRGADPTYWSAVEEYFDTTKATAIKTEAWLKDVGLGRDIERHERALAYWYRGVKEESLRNGLTPRYVLQTLGTEFGRKQRSTIWVDYAQRMALRLLMDAGGYLPQEGYLEHYEGAIVRPRFVVITDGRFANEIAATKQSGGVAIRIDSPVAEGLAGAAGQHRSETEQNSIPDGWFDAVFVNDKSGGLEACRRAVKAIVDNLILPKPDWYYSLRRPEMPPNCT